LSITFPSAEFFRSLQEAMDRDPTCTEHLEPSEAYCGLAIDQRLFVLEFDGRRCAGIAPSGNELDLDFVVAGPAEVWRQALEALDDPNAGTDAALPSLVEKGALEIRSADDEGQEMARAALPFLQVFLEQARGLDLKFD
jgi:hypothetical protein